MTTHQSIIAAYAEYAPVERPDVRPVNVARAIRIARLYDLAPTAPVTVGDRHRLRCSYIELTHAIRRQFRTLERHGMRFDFTPEDPYASSPELFADARNGRIRVFSTDPDTFTHSFLTPYQNDLFRAVHDAFGHALHGFSFGPHGEDNAYRTHRQSLPASAWIALACETRGQNSWVNFGPFAHLAPSERPFAEQKALVLPEWAILS